MNSFFPAEASDDSKIQRCIFMVKLNRNASRKFYEVVHNQIDLHDCVRFMLAILVQIKREVTGQKAVQNQQVDSSMSCDESGDKENAPAPKANAQTDPKPAEEKPQDPEVLAGLLDIVCIMWLLRSKEIGDPANQEYRSLLEKKGSKILSLLFKTYRSVVAFLDILKYSS